MAGKNNQVANNTCSLLQGDQTPSALSDYLALTPNLSTTLQIEGDYPERLAVRDFQKDWEVDHPNYEKLRPYYVSEEVLAKSGGIADPEDISKVKRDFVGFDLDDLGRPLNPLGRTGIAGRGGIYRWGESSTVDAVMIKNALTKPELLVIEKNAKPKPALPGGFVELGERKDEATVREVVEETTLRPEGTTQWIGSLITRSRRTTDHAWIRTNGFLNIVGRRHSAFNKEPQGKDDADEAYWALLTTELISGMSIRHRILVEAACDMAEIAIRNAS